MTFVDAKMYEIEDKIKNIPILADFSWAQLGFNVKRSHGHVTNN